MFASLRGHSSARRRLHAGGLFIAFEGGEGAGKSSQVRRLAESLRSNGSDVTVTREPGATPAGAQIRKILLDKDALLSDRAEALLFAADRAHHVDTVIKPGLDAGRVVITDRYVDSSLAYQGAGRSLAMDEVRRLSRWATAGLEPDLTILLDIDPRVGLERARGRAEADRMESESLGFHDRVRTCFQQLADADPKRYLVLDAELSPETLAQSILGAVRALTEVQAEPSESSGVSRPADEVTT